MENVSVLCVLGGEDFLGENFEWHSGQLFPFRCCYARKKEEEGHEIVGSLRMCVGGENVKKCEQFSVVD